MRRLSIRAMPIYEYYSPDTNRIYSFYAKTLAQGRQIPVCPDNPKARMRKIVSSFAVTGRRQKSPAAPAEFTAESSGGVDDARMGAAMSAMEREFSNADENDPRAMARMMRRMAELSGEKLDEPMEEAVRKLEEGADPDSLEEELGGQFGDETGAGDVPVTPDQEAKAPEAKTRFKVCRPPPVRDPKLYDYE